MLNDAVGHDSASVWPGGKGTSILLAHDVSYFSDLGAIHTGDRIFWVDDCRRLLFKVDRIEVTRPGGDLPHQSGGIGVALVTCWPSNALFWTPDRLVVLASLVGTQSAARPRIPATPPLNIVLRVPAALASQGLGLSQNGLLVGHLRLAGKPDRSWAQSADPLRATRLAFEDLAAARLTVDAANRTWWSALGVPGIPMPTSIAVGGDFDVTLRVYGTRVGAVILASPGVTVGFVVRSGELYISNVVS